MRRIVVDAMGGDHAPEEIVKGVAEASLSLRDSELILVGDAAIIGRILPECRHDGSRVRVHHAADFIAMDEVPARAIKDHPEASVLVAAELVANGEGDAMVSAGNTGAAILACAKHWKRLPSIERTALAAVYPTELRRGEKNDPFSLILDVGATIDATAQDLVAFALMGSAYAKVISQNEKPRVALLSNGTEAGKGPKAVVDAHQILRGAKDINFIGNIEGLDIPRGVADVVVCSGYVGNVVVKMLEGVSQTIINLARYAYKEKLMWRAALALLSTGLSKLKDVTDWEQYGGAPLLGFDHLLIKAHGRSKATALANAIRVADKGVREKLVETIAEQSNKLLAQGAPPEPDAKGQEPSAK